MRGRQGCAKKNCSDLAKTISGNKISNFKTFGTTGSTGTLWTKRRAYRSKPALL